MDTITPGHHTGPSHRARGNRGDAFAHRLGQGRGYLGLQSRGRAYVIVNHLRRFATRLHEILPLFVLATICIGYRTK